MSRSVSSGQSWTLGHAIFLRDVLPPQCGRCGTRAGEMQTDGSACIEGGLMGVFGTPRMGENSERHDIPPVVANSPSMTEESTGLGPWTIGRLDSRVVKILTAVGFAVPVVVYIIFLQHFTVNAMWQDQWDDVPVIRESFAHFPDWSSLWLQHVDNRILFPNLIVIALAHTLHYNITVEEYVSALMLFAATAVFIWCHKRRSPQTPLLFYCPVAFLTLTLAEWQNTIWGFQMAWYLVLLSLAMAIAFLDRLRFTWPVFSVAIVVAIVGSYSSLQGLLIWPIGLVLLYQRRRPVRALIVWVMVAGATTVLYFHNFTSSKAFNPRETILKGPFDAVKFFIFALGDIAGVQETKNEPANGWVMAFGVVILVLAVLVLLRWGLRRDEHSAAPIGIALILYGLLFDALITQGRVFLFYFRGFTIPIHDKRCPCTRRNLSCRPRSISLETTRRGQISGAASGVVGNTTRLGQMARRPDRSDPMATGRLGGDRRSGHLQHEPQLCRRPRTPRPRDPGCNHYEQYRP